MAAKLPLKFVLPQFPTLSYIDPEHKTAKDHHDKYNV